MSSIERDTAETLKPILRYPLLPRTLNRREQTTLAKWVALRAIEVDGSAGGPSTPFLSHAERKAFANGNPVLPLPNTHIWLAALPNGTPNGVRARSHYLGNNDRTIGIQVFDCVVGQIALQVVHRKGSVMPKEFGQNTVKWRRLTIQLWPAPKVTASWPPDKKFLKF